MPPRYSAFHSLMRASSCKESRGIDAPPDKTLVFHFKDGSTAERHWEHISRAKSWTPEMKEIARQRALAQRRGEKWQEP